VEESRETSWRRHGALAGLSARSSEGFSQQQIRYAVKRNRLFKALEAARRSLSLSLSSSLPSHSLPPHSLSRPVLSSSDTHYVLFKRNVEEEEAEGEEAEGEGASSSQESSGDSDHERMEKRRKRLRKRSEMKPESPQEEGHESFRFLFCSLLPLAFPHSV